MSLLFCSAQLQGSREGVDRTLKQRLVAITVEREQLAKQRDKLTQDIQKLDTECETAFFTVKTLREDLKQVHCVKTVHVFIFNIVNCGWLVGWLHCCHRGMLCWNGRKLS